MVVELDDMEIDSEDDRETGLSGFKGNVSI